MQKYIFNLLTFCADVKNIMSDLKEEAAKIDFQRKTMKTGNSNRD